MDQSTFWTMIAAIATAVSAVVIAWQSVLTRLSVKQARRSADASERAVAAANESLALARTQASHSELMSAEAVRSRMEVNGPAVFLTLTDSDGHGPKPFAYARSDAFDVSFLDEVKPGAPFWAVRDDDSWLFAIVRARLENASSNPVVIEPGLAFDSFANDTISGRIHQVRLPANGSKAFFLAVGARVSEWIRATRALDSRTVIPAASQWATVLDGETGILISQLVRIQGTLLESGPSNGMYTLRRLGPDPSHNYPSKLLVDKQERLYVVGRDETGSPRLLSTRELSVQAANG
jgi:hypothetical protein